MVVTAAEVQRVEGELQQCVAALQFEAAATLRDRLKALKAELAAGEAEVQRLEAELQRRVETLEFEAAAQLRDRIKALRSSLGAASAPAGETTVQQDGRKLPDQTLGADQEEKDQPFDCTKTVVLRLPVEATEGQLKAIFPMAKYIQLRLNKYNSYAVALVEFGTVAEAETLAEQGQLEVAGTTVNVRMKVDTAKWRNKREEEKRKVFVGRLPLSTKEADLRQHFPAAMKILLHKGNAYSYAFMIFPTVAEAKAAAAQGKVSNQMGVVVMAGERATIDAAVRGHTRQEEDNRTVYVARLPLDSTVAELQQHFSTAERVIVRQGKAHAYAFVMFNTVAEAEAQAATGTIEIGGKTATLDMAGHKGARQDFEGRTVFMARLPLTANEAELRQCFPTAESAKVLPGRQQAMAMVRFPTAEEAQSIASQSHTEFAGKPFFVCMAGDSQAIEKDKEEARSRSVFLSTLPLAISEADLKQRFPSAEAVKLRCGQFRATALVQFHTVEEAESVAVLAHVELGGRSIPVCMDGRLGSTECRTVYLARLSPATTQAELEQSFPTAESIRLVCKRSRTFAFVTFPDAEEALAVAQQAEVVVAGQTTAVSMDDAERGQQRATTEAPRAPKRSKLSPIGA